MKLEQQIEYALQNKITLTQKAKELCDFFERKNREINKIADMLIERAERNRYNSMRTPGRTFIKVIQRSYLLPRPNER